MIDKLSLKEPFKINDDVNVNDITQFNIEPQSKKILINSKIGVKFSRKIRYLIFFILVLTNLIMNMDHGTIPAATLEIKQDLKIDNDVLGVFGSLVYLGNLIGKFLQIK